MAAESQEVLETLTLGEETPKSSKKSNEFILKKVDRSGKKDVDSPSRKQFAPSTPTQDGGNTVAASAFSPVVKSSPEKPAAPPPTTTTESTAKQGDPIVEGIEEKIGEKTSVQDLAATAKASSVMPVPLARRTSLENTKSKATPIKSFLPKKAHTTFVSKIAVPEFRSPARVKTSVTPSATKILDSQATPKASLTKSVSRRNPTKFMTQLQAVSPDDKPKSAEIAEKQTLVDSYRSIDSPIPENIAAGHIENVEATTFSPSSNSGSIPESEATVSTEQQQLLKLPASSSSPGPTPGVSHSRIPSATRTSSPAALKESRVETPKPAADSKVVLSIDDALRHLQSSKNSPIKSRLLSLSKSLQSSEFPLDQTTVTNILTGLFKFEEGHVSIQTIYDSLKLTLFCGVT